MASIPLPALDIKTPQQPDLLQKYGQLMALRNNQQQLQMQQQEAPLRIQGLQQQAQLGSLQVEQQQQAIKDQQGIAKWYQTLNPNDPKAFDPIEVGKSLSSNGVSGTGILNVQGKMLQQRQTLATLTKDQLANREELSNNLYNSIDGVIGITDPTQRAQALTPILTTAQSNKLIDPITAQKLLANPSTITDDQLKQFQKGLGISAAFIKSVASKQEAQTGQDKLTASMNPNSSLYAPTSAAIALGTAPGASQIQTNEVQQAGKKAAAEENARMPGEMALARQRQALSQGDPNAAAQLLVNGDATLSELKARGATPDFIARSLFAANRLSGGKYNAQAADAGFQVAKSPANVAFFGSAKSLTDKGGTLDQLEQAGKNIPHTQFPTLNTIADWEKLATGSGPLAHYAATALGVADDYAKVMGDGQGSDTSRLQALNLIKSNASEEGRGGAVTGIRDAVVSQTKSRIGNNPVLGRMYGSPASSGGNPNPSGIAVTAPNGKVYTFKDQQSADAFKKNAGIQ